MISPAANMLGEVAPLRHPIRAPSLVDPGGQVGEGDAAASGCSPRTVASTMGRAQCDLGGSSPSVSAAVELSRVERCPGGRPALKASTVSVTVAGSRPMAVGQLLDRVGHHRGEHRRHEERRPTGRVDQDVADLVGLGRHQAAPDGVALGPEVLALVVEAVPVGVDHDRRRGRSRVGSRCHRRSGELDRRRPPRGTGSGRRSARPRPGRGRRAPPLCCWRCRG